MAWCLVKRRDDFTFLPLPLRVGLPSGPFLSSFPTNILYAFLIAPMRATCPVHLTLLDLMAQIIFGKAF